LKNAGGLVTNSSGMVKIIVLIVLVEIPITNGGSLVPVTGVSADSSEVKSYVHHRQQQQNKNNNSCSLYYLLSLLVLLLVVAFLVPAFSFITAACYLLIFERLHGMDLNIMPGTRARGTI
jgi:hypothetical protein